MKTLVSWSSGKDSAWIVDVLRARGDVEIGALLDDNLRAGAARRDARRARGTAGRARQSARAPALAGPDSIAVSQRRVRARDDAGGPPRRGRGVHAHRVRLGRIPLVRGVRLQPDYSWSSAGLIRPAPRTEENRLTPRSGAAARASRPRPVRGRGTAYGPRRVPGVIGMDSVAGL